MKSVSLLALVAPIAAGGGNPLHLDNGGDFPSWLNDPFVGSDPAGGDFEGDFYWKVWPAEVLRSSSGTLDLVGVQYWVFDQDWDLDDATLYAWSISKGVDSGKLAQGGSGASPGNIEPLFTDPALVVVGEVPQVGLGNPQGPGGCPPDGGIAGWVVTETWEEPGTGQAVPIVTLDVNGSTDYVYSAFFPDDQSATFGGVNCGGGGNATFQYFASADTPSSPEGGENLPNLLGTFYNAYGGRHFGDPQGQGFHFYVAQPYNRGADVSLLFDRPMLNMRVDADVDGHGPESGLAGLELPMGLDTGGLPTGTVPRLGWQLYSSEAPVSGAHFGVVFASLELPLPTPGLPIFGDALMLNPDDPLFLPAFLTWGLAPFEQEGDFVVATSALEPIPPQISLFNLPVRFQGFDLDLDSETWVGSQVTQTTFRPH